MNKYAGIKGRDKLVDDLTQEYISRTAETVIFIQASCGQGKSYVVDRIIKNLIQTHDIKIFRNQYDELISPQKLTLMNSNKPDSLNISGGISIFSLGVGLGWESQQYYYEKIRHLLSANFKSNIFICVENINEVSDNLRFLLTCILGNIQKLEQEFKKRIFLLITDTQDSYANVINKYAVSSKIIFLPFYTLEDTKNYLGNNGSLCRISDENMRRIFELSKGNFDLAEFLYEEILVKGNDYFSTLQDVVSKRISIIKAQGEKKEIGGKDMERIIFSASLSLKKFSANFLSKIIETKTSTIYEGLEVATNEALLEKDIQKYYHFISTDIQKYIAKLTLEKQENLLLAYYNYYTQNEQDEYYLRAYYIYKFQEKISSFSFSLYVLAYSIARKMFDDIKIKKIEYIMEECSAEEYKQIFLIIKQYYDNLSNNESIEKVTQDYKILQNSLLDLVVKAELTCEYFHYIYRRTKMDTPMYHDILNQCISYAMNDLCLDKCDTDDNIKTVDETILRLKIIYEIAPCVLDQMNNYEEFQRLYNKSQELTNLSKNSKQHSIGEYIENVFNRKAFLFSNQAMCSAYYEKAKRYFARNKIWVEYYITLVCEAGTDIVIQKFDEAIELCKKAKNECVEKSIVLPQIEKLHNNQIIAEFLLAEQKAKTFKKAATAARIATKQLKDLLTGEKNATQFVIYTNICSLLLYCNNEKQYLIYKKKLEKLYKCRDIADIEDESIDDFYRYYFAWFELYRMICNQDWDRAWQYINSLDNFVPALFKKQEVFWEYKNNAVKEIINKQKYLTPYDFWSL